MSETVSSSKAAFFKLYDNPKWQKMRLEVLDRAGWLCEECKDGTTNLQVHHRYYEGDRAPWDYPDDCYQSLCRPCHEKKTATTKKTKQLIGFLPQDEGEQVLGYVLARTLWQKMNALEKLDGELEVSSRNIAEGIADFCGNSTSAADVLIHCVNGKISEKHLFDVFIAGWRKEFEIEDRESKGAYHS